jgi:AraC family transcriptional regulator
MNPQTEAIAAGLAFIEEHLCDPISVGDIADAAGYSLFHFLRTFNKIIHHTPYDYLIRRRLSYGAKLLLETDARLLDIALECQFDSHEGFTRAFRRLFGVPPSTWRTNQFPDRRRIMPPLQQEDLAFRLSLGDDKPKLVQRNVLYLVGWMQLNTADNQDHETLRQAFTTALSEKQIPGAGEDIWEVRMLPTPEVRHEMAFVGFQVRELLKVPDQYVIKIIAEGQYLCFSHPTLPEYRKAAFDYLYHTFLPKSGLRLGLPMEIECHDKTHTLFIPLAGEEGQ